MPCRRCPRPRRRRSESCFLQSSRAEPSAGAADDDARRHHGSTRVRGTFVHSFVPRLSVQPCVLHEGSTSLNMDCRRSAVSRLTPQAPHMTSHESRRQVDVVCCRRAFVALRIFPRLPCTLAPWWSGWHPKCHFPFVFFFSHDQSVVCLFPWLRLAVCVRGHKWSSRAPRRCGRSLSEGSMFFHCEFCTVHVPSLPPAQPMNMHIAVVLWLKRRLRPSLSW